MVSIQHWQNSVIAEFVFQFMANQIRYRQRLQPASCYTKFDVNRAADYFLKGCRWLFFGHFGNETLHGHDFVTDEKNVVNIDLLTRCA